MTDEKHQHGYQRPPREFREQQPIARLWRVQKGRAKRMAALYSHELGFELKIVDQRGDFVFTKVFRSEPDCVQEAAGRHDTYLAKGWVPVQD